VTPQNQKRTRGLEDWMFSPKVSVGNFPLTVFGRASPHKEGQSRSIDGLRSGTRGVNPCGNCAHSACSATRPSSLMESGKGLSRPLGLRGVGRFAGNPAEYFCSPDLSARIGSNCRIRVIVMRVRGLDGLKVGSCSSHFTLYPLPFTLYYSLFTFKKVSG